MSVKRPRVYREIVISFGAITYERSTPVLQEDLDVKENIVSGEVRKDPGGDRKELGEDKAKPPGGGPKP